MSFYEVVVSFQRLFSFYSSRVFRAQLESDEILKYTQVLCFDSAALRSQTLVHSTAILCRIKNMAAAGSSMLYSFLLFIATLSLQEMFRVKLASSELFTILGGFTSSLIFLMLLTVREYWSA
ncbi:hypothetical protein STAS_16971 [Striga asiatica]|uniref:Uncharacterized protein n=1 Tax=Striga asiatica TaxID=4170 RepID=A0A5A7Q5H4_STRAF|nr:hypothetical protein STAS_16971 [Striga asiatica]